MGLFDWQPLTREELIEVEQKRGGQRQGQETVHDDKGRTARHRPWHEIVGDGPIGKTCGDCRSLVSRGKYFKCGEFLITSGPGTDIRKKDPACEMFQDRTGAVMDETSVTSTMSAKLGMTVKELRALVKPLFMVLYDNNRTSITIEREGALVNVVVR